jgi:hypothetical protein
LAQSFQRELPDEESNQFRTRLELLNILNSIGDIDDDATSAWSLFVLDEQIHEAEKANRNLLREKSKFGTNTVFSRTELKSRGLLEEGFSRKSSPFFIDVVATFDLICKTVGIEPIFAKLYANAMTQLALAIAKSSVFSVDKTRSMNEVYRFASVLAQQVEVLDAFDPNSGSIEELRSNYLAITFKESGIVDLLSIMNWEAEINEDYLDEWTEKFGAMLEGFLIKSEATSDERIEMEDEHALEFDHVEDENVRDAAVRLIEVEELFRKGLLTDDEYAVKRKQIIDQI